jgi:hypothetical protein
VISTTGFVHLFVVARLAWLGFDIVGVIDGTKLGKVTWPW